MKLQPPPEASLPPDPLVDWLDKALISGWFGVIVTLLSLVASVITIWKALPPERNMGEDDQEFVSQHRWARCYSIVHQLHGLGNRLSQVFLVLITLGAAGYLVAMVDAGSEIQSFYEGQNERDFDGRGLGFWAITPWDTSIRPAWMYQAAHSLMFLMVAGALVRFRFAIQRITLHWMIPINLSIIYVALVDGGAMLLNEARPVWHSIFFSLLSFNLVWTVARQRARTTWRDITPWYYQLYAGVAVVSSAFLTFIQAGNIADADTLSNPTYYAIAGTIDMTAGLAMLTAGLFWLAGGFDFPRMSGPGDDDDPKPDAPQPDLSEERHDSHAPDKPTSPETISASEFLQLLEDCEDVSTPARANRGED